MYRVYVKNMNGEYPIYEPLDDTLRIFEPVLTQEAPALSHSECTKGIHTISN